MLCDECGKNKSTVHLTEIVNDQVTKLNLCEGCAKQKGADAEQHFGIADLLAALSDTESHTPHSTHSVAAANISPKVKCQNCGMTYEDFKKVGRLGCSKCYGVFKASLTPLLKRIHGSNQHLGKTPNPEFTKEMKASYKIHEELVKTKEELQKAVRQEEFEEAASLRDKVKFLEKKIKEHKD